MVTEIEKYEEQIGVILKAKAEAQRISAIISDVGAKLTDWGTATIIGVALAPDAYSVSPSGALDLSSWPSADDIGKALAGYRFAKINLRAAYERIPKSLRQGLKEPNHYF